MRVSLIDAFMLRRALFSASVLCLFLTTASAKLIVFGDSGSDTANVITNSRPMWVDVVSEGMGLGPSDPWTSVGDTDTNFSQSGARAEDVTPGYRDVPEQIADYLNETGGSASSTDLFLTFQGGNDLINGTDPVAAADFVNTNLETLIAAGARRFAVANMIDGSRAPGNVFSLANTIAFNNRLASNLATLRLNNPGVLIYEIDFFGTVNDILDNPGDYGLTNVTDGWTSTAMTDPVTDYFWYDNVHVTSSGQAIIGQAALSAIPEPSAFGLLGLAGGLLALCRRRK